ncbi:MAG: glycosyltransferase [Planctomycetota bacterium]
MIFVTVGAQMPFDRLIRLVDEWAGRRGRTDVFAQIGRAGYRPRHIRWADFLTPEAFREHAMAADAIVSHAGMGTILSALELSKPLLVFPRLASQRETRSDHQTATARAWSERGALQAALSEAELLDALDRIEEMPTPRPIGREASPELLQAMRRFLQRGAGSPPGPASFDGAICFGGVDWWYHNRGHYDLRMMGEFSLRVPVLYVNSIGMRMPPLSEGGMFFRRVGRKLHSVARGLVRVRPGFAVISPLTAPALRATPWGKRFLARQVRRAARRLGIRRPLLWIACPPAVETVPHIPHAALVYQRTDRYELFPGVDREAIRALDRRAKEAADLTLFCASLLREEEGAECRRALYADHGVDFETFAAAGDSPWEPADVKPLPRPRIGFVGGMDAQTFDPDLFREAARRMPDCSFVMVGAVSLPRDWCSLPNVHFLGRKELDEVPGYMAACDALIMPWQKSEWIRSCNPVKLKEYLAAGRPVVSTPFHELRRYEGLVRVAEDAEAFARAVRAALEEPCDAARLRSRVRHETWAAQAGLVFSALEEMGLHASLP